MSPWPEAQPAGLSLISYKVNKVPEAERFNVEDTVSYPFIAGKVVRQRNPLAAGPGSQQQRYCFENITDQVTITGPFPNEQDLAGEAAARQAAGDAVQAAPRRRNWDMDMQATPIVIPRSPPAAAAAAAGHPMYRPPGSPRPGMELYSVQSCLQRQEGDVPRDLTVRGGLLLGGGGSNNNNNADTADMNNIMIYTGQDQRLVGKGSRQRQEGKGALLDGAADGGELAEKEIDVETCDDDDDDEDDDDDDDDDDNDAGDGHLDVGRD